MVATLVDVVLEIVLASTLLGAAAVVIANVVLRSFFAHSLQWLDEVTMLALVILAFLGGAVAYRRDQLPTVRVLLDRVPARILPYQLAAVDWLVLGGAIWLAKASLPYLQQSWAGRTVVLRISTAWSVLPVTAGLVAFALYAFERLVTRSAKPVAASFVAMAAVCVPLAISHFDWAPALNGAPVLWISLGLFVAFVLLGVPISLVFAFIALLYLYLPAMLPLVAVPATMHESLGSFILVAAPFFVLAGFVMDRGGATIRLIDFLKTLLGHFRGGLLLVEIAAMFIFSGISGSKAADVAAVGTSMSKTLSENGYDEAEGTAVLAASAVMGETIPPSIVMLVLGSISTLSIGALFLGGLLPATVLAITLGIVVVVRARRSAPSELQIAGRANVPEILRRARGATLSALTLVILFLGIFGGFATPTETSAIAVAYALVVAMIIYRELNLKQFVAVVRETNALVGFVLFTIGSAGAFSWALTQDNIPQRIANGLLDLPGGKPVFMLVSIAALVVTGMVLEGLPAILVMAPILLPVASDLHVSLLTYGLVLIIAMGIGTFAPPAGIGFFITCAVTKTSIEKATPRVLIYFAFLLIGLLLVAFVPWFSTFIPEHVFHKNY